MSLWKRIKQAFKNYLTRMEQSNKELFGNGRPDCCKLNSSRNNRRL
jgi:hypothetical protein